MKILSIITGLLIIGVLISGCLENENPLEENDFCTNHEGTIYNYSTPGYEINKTQASIVWRKVNFSDDAKFVSREKDYSVIVFVQSFNENPSDLSSAEWIAVATSIPVKNEDVKIAIFRLDYQTLDFKRSYYFSYQGEKILSLQQSAFFMEEEMKKEPKGGKFLDEKLMALYGGNYISSYPGSFSGGTILFNKYAGKVIFHATTVQGGRSSGMAINIPGRIITPGEDTNGTSPFNTDISIVSLSSPASRGTNTIAGLSFTVPDYVPNGSEIFVDYGTGMLNIDGSMEQEPEGFYIIPEKKRLALGRVYLFTWDEIPGKDSVKLIEYLERNYLLIDWLKTAKIEKIDNDRTIRVFNETESILLKLNDEKNKIDIRTGIYAPHELFVKMDENKLHVYDRQRYESGNGRLVAYSNLTVKTGNESVEGDYFITASVKYRGWEVGKNVFSFKIGKGGKKTEGGSMTESSLNIGYSADNPPPLNMTEREEMTEIVLSDPYLKEKMYKLIAVTSEFLDLENYSGFFVVVTLDAGDPDYTGEIIRYIVDREEKKITGSSSTERKALEYFRGEAFDETKDNFTKRWDARNFPGLWLDNETNASTETLVIDQSLPNNTYRIIDRHNLIYTTNLIPLRYLVYAQVNWTPEGTDGFYQALGWMGEKHVYLQGNRLAKIIFEQNATEEKEMTIGESWELGEGYRVIANSISAKDSGGRQAWITLFKDSNKLADTVMVQQYGPNKFYTYHMNLSDVTPNFMIYYARVDTLPRTDAAYFKYTWLRSNDTTEIKPGNIFGIMEVTSFDNGRIELRNRAPIELAPESTINLMGNMNIKVGSSNTSLSFHPYRVRKS